MRPGFKRTGCAAFPCAYTSCLFRSIGDGPICLFLVPFQEVLTYGIALPDIEQFFESANGLDHFKKFGVSLCVKQNEYVFVPNGFVVLGVGCGSLREGDVTSHTLVQFPLLVVDWFKDVPDLPRQAIMAQNRLQFTKKHANTMWCDWSTIFEQFAGLCPA